MDQTVSAGQIEATGEYSTNSGLGNAEITMKNVFFANGFASTPNLYVNFLGPIGGKYDTKVSGNIDSFDVTLSDQYFGRIPSGSFSIHTVYDALDSKIQGNFSVNLETLQADTINAKATLSADFLEGTLFTDCLDLRCEPSNLASEFQIDFNENWLKGNSTCSEYPCSMDSTSHHLETSNTEAIFKILNREKILSPFVMVYLFSVISGSEKLIDGHKIKLN